MPLNISLFCFLSYNAGGTSARAISAGCRSQHAGEPQNLSVIVAGSRRRDHIHEATSRSVLDASESCRHHHHCHSCESAGRLLVDTKAARIEAAVGAAGDVRVAADRGGERVHQPMPVRAPWRPSAKAACVREHLPSVKCAFSPVSSASIGSVTVKLRKTAMDETRSSKGEDAAGGRVSELAHESRPLFYSPYEL